MTTPEQELLDEIVGFCQSAGITPTEFGKRSCNNPAFVTRLKKGNYSPSLRVAHRVRTYIKEQGE